MDYCLSLGKDTSMDKLTTLNKLARLGGGVGSDVSIHCNHPVAMCTSMSYRSGIDVPIHCNHPVAMCTSMS